MKTARSAAARGPDPTLNPLLTCLSRWDPGKHDSGTGIRFPVLVGGEFWLLLTFNLSDQGGKHVTLVCTILPIFEAGKTKQSVNKQKLWPFLLSSVWNKQCCCFFLFFSFWSGSLQSTDRHLIISSPVLLFLEMSLLLPWFDLMEFTWFFFIL